jgi:carboxyl-terminal processing protease
MGGRGIEPDVEVPLDDQSELEQSLQRRAAFFFFANHYAATHPTIPQDFEVTEEVFSEFETWLSDQSFSYRTAAERSAEMLSSNLASIGYTEARDEMEALRTAIMEAKGDDFERHSGRLQERIRTEILARYFGESAQIEASLGHDPQFVAATRLIQTPDELVAILRP